ncbi:unnamed protein product [Ixodes pacificus]
MHLAPCPFPSLLCGRARTHKKNMFTFVCCSHAVHTDDVKQVSKLQEAKLETIQPVQPSFCSARAV